ncbi:nucleoporin NUP2 TDEL_0D02880 [Torulaspora delbrueckii]|uniref:RanBD1 domain-containing protein n=1 Tax=Torulaspora delbrueckii TaxID=4950 RepID=G8ZTC8_TORDE|nr:hypothetical protein TDEL_0D02880 [Torulaspora delbrueckii]CCE91872.1 hypothetical protein TDEL_0D02880 [Torulaspora delbrueckii]
MAKRFADSQITRETHRENDSDSDEESTGHGVASAAVMSKRKIAMPKRKMAANFNRQPESTKENSSSAFGFLQGSASTGSDSDKNAKLKALNLQFKDKVISFVDQDPCADLSPVFEKYKTYIQSIGAAKPAAKPAAQPAFTIAPKPVQQVDDKPESSSDEEPEVKVEGPKFTINTKPPTSNSVFSFGATKVAKKDDSDSDCDEVEIKGPQFTFSGTVKSDVFKLPKATEPTGEKPKDSEPKESEPEVKPAFSFGNSKQPSEKPAFSFGAPKETTNGKPSFTFGKPQEGTKDKPKFDFSFSSAAKNDGTATDAQKPSLSFKFGADKENKDEKTEKSAIPSFSFNNHNEKKDEKIAAKPAFTFGAPNSSTAPSFTFGKAATNEKTDDASKPSNGFKFSLPFGQKAPENATTSNEAKDDKSTTVTADDEHKADEKPDESKPMDLQNGEEGENALFSQRSKLMIFNPETKAYDSRGVGEMKLLQSNEDKSKIRFLCRSDGMGNILLNTRVVKDFSYTPLTAENENLVKIPTIEADNKLVTYVVKFKQKADGRQFVKAIEDVKKDM